MGHKNNKNTKYTIFYKIIGSEYKIKNYTHTN